MPDGLSSIYYKLIVRSPETKKSCQNLFGLYSSQFIILYILLKLLLIYEILYWSLSQINCCISSRGRSDWTSWLGSKEYIQNFSFLELSSLPLSFFIVYLVHNIWAQWTCWTSLIVLYFCLVYSFAIILFSFFQIST